VTVREILTIGHPLLRTPASPVPAAEIGGPLVRRIVGDLIDTMRSADGAGLAANQIGELYRIVVMEVNQNPRYPYKPPIPLTVAINPQLEVLDDQRVVINEGCLSVPLRGDVRRAVNVRVRYTDADGDDHDTTVRGLTAGTWQHECDHLDGTLIVDRAVPATLSTWDSFEAFHRDAFVERITRFAAEMES